MIMTPGKWNGGCHMYLTQEKSRVQRLSGHSHREGMRAGPEGSWSHDIPIQEAER